MKNIIVIEIYERDLCSVTPCDTMEEAIETANELLKDHCDTTGYGDELEEAVEKAKEAGVEASGVYFAFASKTNSNAWSNYGDRDWDAFIIEY